MAIFDPRIFAREAIHDPDFVPEEEKEEQFVCPECSLDMEKMIGNKPCSLCDAQCSPP